MIIAGIKYTDPIDLGLDAPYDGIDIKPDRQGGWLVRHKLLNGWITGVSDRALADRIKEALDKLVINVQKEAK